MKRKKIELGKKKLGEKKKNKQEKSLKKEQMIYFSVGEEVYIVNKDSSDNVVLRKSHDFKISLLSSI